MAEVSARGTQVNLTELQPSSRNFKAALCAPGMSLIAEIKKASPSAGDIAEVDVAKQAALYEEAGANAISILCDEGHFKGSPADLREAAQATKNVPLLFKDFIISPEQIYEARHFGADAILLIAALLSEVQMQAFLDITRSLGMDALCEVHNEAELQKVLATDAEIIGINHRNLHDFSMDMQLSHELVKLIPEGKIVVAESGVFERKDVQALPKRSDAILVGTSIMTAPDTYLKINSLKSERPLVKVCGVQSEAEARHCEALGVELIGLNFVEASHRCLSVDQAREIAGSVDRVKTVGVFQDVAMDEVNRIASEVELDYVQLVGDYNVSEAKFPVIRTVGIEDARTEKVAATIVDGPQPGSGQAFEGEMPEGVFVAGGITPENAPKDVFGIDLATGLETERRRDMQKITELMEHLEGRSLRQYLLQNRSGHFGEYGGAYVPELLAPIMDELSAAFFEAIEDPEFQEDLRDLYVNYAGRRTPLVHCKNLSAELGGAQIYLKNEGLLHTGAHKMNHCLGQALLAKRLGKKRLVAETGAGQHGLATATVAAKFGLECTIYMGAKDYARQRPNVFFMERLGATVIPVTSGGQILKDAVNAAIGDLISNPEDTHFLLGTVCGPHPYPVMNTYFQKIIGEEVRQQALEQIGKLPDTLVACVGGGSNAIGLFYDFLDETDVELRIVEAGGAGIGEDEKGFTHAARFQGGKPGIVEGFKSIFLQNSDGQVGKTQSISAGLDYAGVGPQHAYLAGIDRIVTSYATDDKVLEAYQMLAQTEGVIAAMESCHAAAEAIKIAPKLPKDHVIVFNCSGRGDKDLFITTQHFDKTNFNEFLTRFQ